MQWFEHLETFDLCEKLQAGIFFGMLDIKAASKIRNDWLREAGFLLPVDTEFAEYFKSFKERKPFDHHHRIPLPSGAMTSRSELEYNRLRNQLVKARHRITKQDQ